MERLWYLITQDSELICKLMTEFESNGKVDIPTFLKNQVKTFILYVMRLKCMKLIHEYLIRLRFRVDICIWLKRRCVKGFSLHQMKSIIKSCELFFKKR